MMKAILKDIKDGNLPPEEIPGFAAWGLRQILRQLFWIFFAIIIGGAAGWLLLT
jgi:hypothetical protein